MCRIEPAERRLLITGVGYRALSSGSPDEDIFESSGYKPNMGAAVALRAAQAGYALVLSARTALKLERVRESILKAVPTADIDARPTDVLSIAAVRELAASLPNDRELDLVQCAGLSSGSYRLEDDNPYLPVERVPADLPTMEFDTIVRGLLLVVQSFLDRWMAQSETRLVVVNSMSGIRAYPLGYAHASAKAGLHNAVRALTLELAKRNIFVSEVNPGAVNTGFYDPPAVASSVATIGLEFGYDYRESGIPQIPPSAVADAALLCLRSPAHILSINAVARGQFPHLGA